MADSYKGLTIRIGADTTNLSHALSSVTGSLRSVQSHLNSVKKGLRFDPKNTQSLNRQFQLTDEKVLELSKNVKLLNNAYDSAGNQSAKKLAEGFDSVADSVQRSKLRVTQLEEEIAMVKDSLLAIAESNGLKIDRKNFDLSTAKEQVAGLSGEASKLVQQWERLSDAWKNADTYVKAVGQADSFTTLGDNIRNADLEIKKITNDMANMKFDNAMEEARQSTEKVNNSLDKTDSVLSDIKAELKRVEDALQLDPSNVELASKRTELLGQASTQSAIRTRELKTKLAEMGKTTSSSAKTMSELSGRIYEGKSRFAELTRAIKANEAEVSILESEVSDLWDRFGNNIPFEELKRISSRITELDNETNKLNSELKTTDKELKQLANEKAFLEVKEEITKATAEEKKFKRQVDSTHVSMTKLQNISKRLSGSLTSLRDLFTALGATVTPMLTTALYRIVDATDAVDSAYRNMRKTVQGTEEQFSALYDEALELSQIQVVSAEDILNIEALGGQLGVATDELSNFAQVVSNLDISTNMESEDIATQLGQLSNVLDLDSNQLEKFGDALVRLGNNMPTQESNIMDITSRIASMGKISGFTADQILAWSTAIASTGQDSEAAGTAISNTMSRIETAVGEGGADLAKFAKISGVSADEFAKMWNTEGESSKAFQMFIEGLKKIDDAGGSVSNTLIGLRIKAVRQKQAIMGLTNTTDVLSESLLLSNSAWLNGGDAADEARKKSEGFSGSLAKLKNTLDTLWVSLGDTLTPFLDIARDALDKITEISNSLPKGARVAIVALTGLAATVGPVGRVVFQAAESFKKIKTSMAAAGTASGKAKGMFKNMSKSMMAVQTAGIALAAVLAAVLVSAIVKNVRKTANFRKSIDRLSKSMVTTIKDTKESASALDLFADSSSDTKDSIEDLTDEFNDLADSVNESKLQMQTNSNLTSTYTDTIDSLLRKTNLTTGEYGKLSSAVSGINDLYGTNYELVGNATKGYELQADGVEVSTDALKEHTQAMLLDAAAAVWAESYKTACQVYIDASNAYKEAVDKQIMAKADYDAAMEAGLAGSQLEPYIKVLADATTAVDDCKTAMDTAKSSADEFAGKWEYASSATNEAATDIQKFIASTSLLNVLNSTDLSGFQTELEDAGVSISNLKSLSEDELIKLATLYTTMTPEAFDALLAEVKKGGNKGSIAISNAYNEMISTTKAKTKEMEDAAKPDITEMENAGAKAGKAVGQGLVNGLSSVMSKVKVAASKLGDAAVAGTNNGAGVESPSKFTTKTGIYIGEGLKIGMDKSISGVKKKANELGMSAVSSVSGVGALRASEASNAAYSASEVSRVSRVTYNINFNGTSINATDEIAGIFVDQMYELNRLARMQGA